MEWLVPSAIWSGGALLLIGAITAIFKFGSWHGSVNKDVSSLKEAVEEIKDDIRAIKEDIKKIFGLLPRGNPPQKLLGASSPIALTKKGKEVAKSLGTTRIAMEYAKENVKRFGENPDIEEYEIYDSALMDAKVDFREHKLYKDLRRNAYETSVSIDDALEILAVELRDAYMKLLGISPTRKQLNGTDDRQQAERAAPP